MLPPYSLYFLLAMRRCCGYQSEPGVTSPVSVCYVMTASDKSITIINVNTVTVVGPDHSRIKMQTIPISDICTSILDTGE